ncbi:hypothetical protein LZ32DRAFT_672708 [Colletotrichum eremochloae]|nr:hypothetical protein LZ32DRAFT_672708 [Colletotrichum eremochloae]
MDNLPPSPPPSGGDKAFSSLTGSPPNEGAIVTFQRIDKSPPTLKGNNTTSPVLSDKIKEGMCNIGLAKEFDIWSSPTSKLLDYDLSFLEYLDQVSRLSKAPDLSMKVYYGLRKDHDQQTVQDVYRSGNFVVKLVQIKCGISQGVGLVRVTKTLPNGSNHDSISYEKFRSQTLGAFRDRISTMTRTVSSPVEMGAESKKGTTKDNDQSTNLSYKASSENVVFEAVGGNTILASSPSQWCPTVGDHVNWRVIQRADSRIIIDSLADCGDPGFADVAEAFSGAAQGPVMKGISIPKSSKIDVQFRFKTRLTDDARSHYLYHDIHKPIVVQTISEREILPPRFQGPRAAPYDPNWNDQDGIWTITPILESRRHTHRQTHLTDGSRVVIRSKRGPQTPWFLSVLRTSAGLFVPCITTSEQFVWRIREVVKPQRSKSTTIRDEPSHAPLNHDSLLCLTFDFDDNPRGYRDFQDDDRGFRNVEFPPSESKRLVLVESPNKSDVWKDRGVLLLADGDALKPDTSTKVMTLDDVEITVRIAQFRIDVRGKPRLRLSPNDNSMDDEYDILEKDGCDIESQFKEQQKRIKTKNEGRSE